MNNNQPDGIFQLPEGCRLPTLEAHLSMATPFMDQDDASFNKFGMVTEGGDSTFTPVQISNTHYALTPGPEFCPRLYRGQHTDYGSCRAGLYRGNIKYGDLVYWKLKQIDLLFLMERHPAVFEMFHYWNIGRLRLQISLNAIAQHYGYKTDVIDLTRSLNVAMFFATHKLVNGEWAPAIGNTAILYTVSINDLVKQRQGLFPIGIDPLPRPYAQRAYGLQLGMHDDLHKLAGVATDTFVVTEEIAEVASRNVGGASGIFPYDLFESLIEEQLSKRYTHQNTIARAFLMGEIPHQMTYSEIEYHLKEADYHISKSEIKLPNENQIEAAQESWRTLRQEFCQHMRVRVVADHINTGRFSPAGTQHGTN